MKEVKVYEYYPSRGFRRFTLTGNSVPDCQRETEGQWMPAGSEEVRELYADSLALKNDVLQTAPRPGDTNSEGVPTIAWINEQVPGISAFFTGHASDILESIDPRVSDRYLNRLQHSVCKGIAAVLETVGVSTKVTRVDLSKMKGSTIKGWHNVACSVQTAEGKEMTFLISPLFNTFMRRVTGGRSKTLYAPVAYMYGEQLSRSTYKFWSIDWDKAEVPFNAVGSEKVSE